MGRTLIGMFCEQYIEKQSPGKGLLALLGIKLV